MKSFYVESNNYIAKLTSKKKNNEIIYLSEKIDLETMKNEKTELSEKHFEFLNQYKSSDINLESKYEKLKSKTQEGSN